MHQDLIDFWFLKFDKNTDIIEMTNFSISNRRNKLFFPHIRLPISVVLSVIHHKYKPSRKTRYLNEISENLKQFSGWPGLHFTPRNDKFLDNLWWKFSKFTFLNSFETSVKFANYLRKTRSLFYGKYFWKSLASANNQSTNPQLSNSAKWSTHLLRPFFQFKTWENHWCKIISI